MPAVRSAARLAPCRRLVALRTPARRRTPAARCSSHAGIDRGPYRDCPGIDRGPHRAQLDPATSAATSAAAVCRKSIGAPIEPRRNRRPPPGNAAARRRRAPVRLQSGQAIATARPPGGSDRQGRGEDRHQRAASICPSRRGRDSLGSSRQRQRAKPSPKPSTARRSKTATLKRRGAMRRRLLLGVVPVLYPGPPLRRFDLLSTE